MKLIDIDWEMSLLRIGKFEFWWRDGSWCRPKEWVFHFDNDCDFGCVVIYFAFFTIGWISKSCDLYMMGLGKDDY